LDNPQASLRAFPNPMSIAPSGHGLRGRTPGRYAPRIRLPDEREANVSTSNSRSSLEEVKVDVRMKISALWIAVLFLFAYGDILGFFQPGQIEEVIGGEISGVEITQLFLFAASAYVAVASVMVFLSLVLRPGINRWANIVLPILYIVSIVASAIGESAYFTFLSIVESALLLLIVRYAWTWPRRERTNGAGVM
jgi:Family of unknown function (DUF6326)